MAVSETSALRYVVTLILIVTLLHRLVRPTPISDGLRAKDLRAPPGRFLYLLNLTEREPKSRAPTIPGEPPEYMLELYNRYAKDRSARPAANIARSFKNEDNFPYRASKQGGKTISLAFNVSVPLRERVVAAELRLYALVRLDPLNDDYDDGIDWKVTVFERRGESCPLFRRSEGGTGDNNSTGMCELAARRGRLAENGWEAFDVTDAVLRCRDPENESQRLELLVESESEVQHKDQRAFFIAEGNHEPALIVFSDNGSKEDPPEKTIPEESGEEENERLSRPTSSTAIRRAAPRARRNAKGNRCKRTALYVDFKEIGWDSWIVAPPGFEAYACQGECGYPLLPQVTPTKHAVIQTLLNLKSPQKVSRACCVPTKLDPISLLYKNENGHVIFQHKYEGMVVAECGCR